MSIQYKSSLVLSVVFFLTNQASLAGALDNKIDSIPLTTKATEYSVEKNAVSSNDYQYLPYLQVGGTRFFNVGNSNKAVGLDFFVPLLQSPTNLIFTDVRYYDRNSKPFEGNIHLGYRHLSADNQNLYGIYGAFDRKRVESGNYFSQLTFGAECWLNRFFIGGNFYQPIGASTRLLATLNEDAVPSKIGMTALVIHNGQYEKALRGADAEIGYEVVKGLTGYVGGYYFSGKEANTIWGPKARIAYDWSLDHGKRILGIFDKVGLEMGIQKDKPRGTTGYLSANLRIGLLPNKNGGLQGASRHMVDLVRRDVDIVSTTYVNKKQTDGVSYSTDPNTGKKYVVSPLTGKRLPVRDLSTKNKDEEIRKQQEEGQRKQDEQDCDKHPDSNYCLGKKRYEEEKRQREENQRKQAAPDCDKNPNSDYCLGKKRYEEGNI